MHAADADKEVYAMVLERREDHEAVVRRRLTELRIHVGRALVEDEPAPVGPEPEPAPACHSMVGGRARGLRTETVNQLY